MAYSNAWSNTFPAGTELANKIDDFLRQLRLDLAERMESVLIEDVTDDPWVLKEGISQVTGNVLVIPFPAIATNYEYSIWFGPYADPADGFCSDNMEMYLPLVLPAGSVITKLEMLADKGANVAINWHLYSKPFAANPAQYTDEVAVIHNAGGIAISTSGAISITVDPAKYYWFEISRPSSGDMKFYAMRVTYDS